MTTATVLVVEDDKGVRKFVVTVLKRAGYEVLEAAGGQEALQKAHSSYSLPSMVYLSLPAHSAGA